MNVVERIVQTLTSSPVMYDICQVVLEGDYHTAITETVDQTGDEKILEIGCGTGYFGQFFNNYTGVDIDPAYIAGAKRQYESATRKFLVGDATALDFPDKSFDKVVVINVIHHLNDDETRAALGEAKRLAKKYVYIFDMSTDRVSFITPLLLSLDNGKFIRPLEEQLKLVSGVLGVETSSVFIPPRKLLGHSVIVCRL